MSIAIREWAEARMDRHGWAIAAILLWIPAWLVIGLYAADRVHLWTFLMIAVTPMALVAMAIAVLGISALTATQFLVIVVMGASFVAQMHGVEIAFALVGAAIIGRMIGMACQRFSWWPR